jgi:hypothetical protein
VTSTSICFPRQFQIISTHFTAAIKKISNTKNIKYKKSNHLSSLLTAAAVTLS